MIGFTPNIYSSLKGIIVEPLINNLIFDSIVYSLSRRITLTTGGVADIVIDPTFYSGTENCVVFLPAGFSGIGSRVNIDLYAATVAAANGTAWIPLNRDNTSSKTAHVAVRYNPTVSSPGTLGSEFIIPSDGVGVAASAGGATQEGLPFKINTGIKYMFRMTNTSASQSFYGAVALSWFEFPRT